MRLIDADALGMYLNYWRYGDFSDIKHEREYAVLSDVIEAVHHAPTVEPIKVGDVCKECWLEGGNVVEVVRCKDCKHGRRWYKHTGEMYVECKMDIDPIDRDSDFFCADGERRGE